MTEPHPGVRHCTGTGDRGDSDMVLACPYHLLGRQQKEETAQRLSQLLIIFLVVRLVGWVSNPGLRDSKAPPARPPFCELSLQ